MEFGVIASCLADYSWKDSLDAAWRLGCEAIELDTRPTAHHSTWSPDRDPEVALAELNDLGLRVGAVVSFADFLQEDDAALEREVEEVRGILDLAFRHRAEVVRLAPPQPKTSMSREAMLAAYQTGCGRVLEHAEQNGMLICMHHDAELLGSPDALLRLVEDSGSYNLRVALDVVELLRALRDVDAVRDAVVRLVPHTAHVILRDARLDCDTGELVEVPVGDGQCPVELVVSDLMSKGFFRPFYVGYYADGDVVQAVKQGIDYFRELPNRLLEEAGWL